MEPHNIELAQGVPHVRQISLHNDAIKALVCQRLGWNEEKYNEFQYEAAISFLTIVAEPLKGKDSHDMKLLNYSPMFWGWWRNQWYSRERSIYQFKNLSALDYEYLHTNDVSGCPETVASFWGHVPEMLKAGKKALKKSTN